MAEGDGVITLLVMTDGRDALLARTIAALKKHARGVVTRGIIHADNGEDHRRELEECYPRYEVVGGARLGFGGAIARAWRHVASLEGPERFVFAIEDDFLLTRRLDLDAMAEVLDACPRVAQMALRRQAWNEAERRAGGVVELHPEAYFECGWRGHRWLEHRLFWTTNASLFRVGRCVAGWPGQDARSEGVYSAAVFQDPNAVCAYWGARDDEPLVHHIGETRVGTGY